LVPLRFDVGGEVGQLLVGHPREKIGDRMRRPLVGFYGGAHRASLRAVMPKFLSATLNFSSGRRRR
jgi:hypothetical protein